MRAGKERERRGKGGQKVEGGNQVKERCQPTHPCLVPHLSDVLSQCHGCHLPLYHSVRFQLVPKLHPHGCVLSLREREDRRSSDANHNMHAQEATQSPQASHIIHAGGNMTPSESFEVQPILLGDSKWFNSSPCCCTTSTCMETDKA